MTLQQHIERAMAQLQSGTTIGRRQTPVISFWPMREKWRKYGQAFEQRGTDGMTLTENGWLIIPATLQLVYFVVPFDIVCQLAYVLVPETNVPIFEEPPARMAEYNAASCNLPRVLTS